MTRQPPCSRDLLHPVARPWRAVELPWGRAEGTTSELLRGGSPDLQCRHRGGKLRKAYDGAPPRPARLRSLGGFQQAPWVTPKATPAGESRGYFSVPSIYFHGNVNCSRRQAFIWCPSLPVALSTSSQITGLTGNSGDLTRWLLYSTSFFFFYCSSRTSRWTLLIQRHLQFCCNLTCPFIDLSTAQGSRSTSDFSPKGTCRDWLMC